MTVSSILQKLDTLEYQTELADVTSLAEGLVQLQHRRYPHLVPMYRTVHRTVPRKMTFRAIRWVNPKRMFPGAGLSEQEMRDMTPEEREKLIVDLNTYREEALVIHNRYNQMIWMIERGQKPYFIPYANIPEDRWMTMQDYMDRAERLKDGTKTWEHTLDVQADTLRRVLREEDSKKLDDIEGLWIGPDGEARAPLFMDIKQKRGQVPMRRERTIKGPDGNVRLKVVPKAFPRLFIAVHPDEVREGEKNRLPPQDQWLDARRVHDSQRDLAAQVGDAGFYLLRLPKAPFRLGTAVRNHLRENGQFISAPAGRGQHPVQLFFDNVPADAVMNRRWNRISQPERGGRHAPDAPFSGPEGQHRRPAPPAPGAVQAFPARQPRPPRPPRPARPAPDPATRTSQIQGNEQEVRDRQNGLGSQKIRDSFMQVNANRDDLLNQWNQPLNLFADAADPTKQNPETAGFTNGTITGQSSPVPRNQGGGARAHQNFTVQIDGKPYIYKVNSEDSRGEMFAYMIDRALGLQTVPGIHAHQYGQDAMKTAFEATHGGDFGNKYHDAIREARLGGGHLMEFCPECKVPGKSTSVVKKMMTTKDGRNEFNKLTMVDFVTDNHDRHAANWMIHPDGKVVAIDNAYHVWNNFPTYDKKRTMSVGGAGGHGGVRDDRDWSGVRDESGAEITEALLEQEAGEFFDEHFDVEKLKAAAQAVNVEFGNLNNVQALRTEFVRKSRFNFSPQLRNLAGPRR